MAAIAKKPGPTFGKSPPELARAFDRAVGEVPDGQVRVVFGDPCLFVGGHMTVGLFGKDLFLRLSEADSAQGGRRQAVLAYGRPPHGRIHRRTVRRLVLDPEASPVG
jgi:hypothetical protein